MIRKHPILFLFLLLVAGGIAYGVYKARQPKAIPVRTTAVERLEQLTSMVSASGEVRAHDMVDIQTEIAGIVVELPVQEGDKVKKGDLLLRIDDFQAKMDRDSAKGRYDSAAADIRRAEKAISTAQANMERQTQQIDSLRSSLAQEEITLQRDTNSLKRYEELLKQRAISQDEYESFESKARISAKRVDFAKNAIDQAEQQLEVTKLAVEEQKVQKLQSEQALKVADAALKRAEDQLKKTTIIAPIDGVIVKLNTDVGERAVPGIQSNPQATLMTLANMGQIESELKVSETDIVRVKLNQKAKVTVDALNDQITSLTGFVSEISAAPIDTNARGSFGGGSSSQEGKDFKVVVSIENPPPALRIGMLCEAEIQIDTRKDVLTIPIAALTPRQGDPDAAGNYVPPPKPSEAGAAGKTAMAEEKKPAGKGGDGKKKGGRKKRSDKKEFQGVFVKGADGMAHFRVVKTGIMGEMEVEVLDGLKEGEEVITGPLASLRQIDEWALVRPETDAERASGEHK